MKHASEQSRGVPTPYTLDLSVTLSVALSLSLSLSLAANRKAQTLLTERAFRFAAEAGSVRRVVVIRVRVVCRALR